jgi:hypothetical protein
MHPALRACPPGAPLLVFSMASKPASDAARAKRMIGAPCE